jgi:hypothetical protein
VPTGVTPRIGVAPQERRQPYRQRRLFQRLAHGGLFQGLAHIHEATGQGPALGWIFALDQDDGPILAVGKLNDDIDRK